MDTYIKQYIALVNGVKLTTLLSLIFLDTVLGIILAILQKKFLWSKLASFVNTSVLQLGLGYLLVGVFATIEPQFSPSVLATWVILDAKLVADCVEKLKQLWVVIKPPQ